MITSWQDVEPLSDAQVAELERYEHRGDEPSRRLFQARDYAAKNTSANLTFDVPPPPDAVRWWCDGNTRRASPDGRVLRVTMLRVGAIAIIVVGQI
jgi:hypothetical protein